MLPVFEWSDFRSPLYLNLESPKSLIFQYLRLEISRVEIPQFKSLFFYSLTRTFSMKNLEEQTVIVEVGEFQHRSPLCCQQPFIKVMTLA